MHRLIMLLALILAAWPLWAGTVQITLNDGSVIEGTIVKEYETRIILRTVAGDQIIPRDSIKAIKEVITVREQYEALVKTKDLTKAADHLALAEWCLKSNLKTEYVKHLNEAVKCDPQCAEAQTALGRVRYERKTIGDDGQIRTEVLWVSPKEMEQLKVREKEDAEKLRVAQAQAQIQAATRKKAAAGDGATTADPVAADAPLADWERDFFMKYIPGLSNEDERKRSVAIKTLVTQKFSSKVPPLLLEVLKTGSDTARGAALETLALGKFVQTIPQIEKSMRDDPVASVRAKAACALGDLGEPIAAKALLQALDDKDPEVISETIYALEKITFSSFDYLGTPDARKAREYFRAAVTRTAGKSRREVLVQITQTGTPLERMKAVQALYGMGERSILTVLIDLLAQPDTQIQFEANVLLGQLTGQDMGFDANTTSQEIKDKAVLRWREWLGHQLNDGSAGAAAGTNDKPALSTHELLAALDGPKKDTAKAQIKAMPPVYAIPLLISGLGNGNFYIRAAAFSLLTEISGQYDSFGYDPNEENEVVRQNALAKWDAWFTANRAQFDKPAPAP
ncbi:MAG: HEAT repeat domain-containing protein [Planctomycetota bacterium]